MLLLILFVYCFDGEIIIFDIYI